MTRDNATPNRRWFDQGHEAFSRTFPAVAAKAEHRPFYVCPECLRAFRETALHTGVLTREDVPPKSVGGKKIVLTCRDCNSRAGHEMDIDARREADILEFFGGRLSEGQGILRSKSGRLPVRFSSKAHQITMAGVPKAVRPADSDGLKEDFKRATLPDGWQDLRFDLQFKSFSPARAEASWLRSAYLVFFAALGYRFVVRPEMKEVRKRIADPNTKAFSFRIVRPQPSAEPILAVIEKPTTFRSFAMVYGQHIVLLPLYGDNNLYRRLEAQPTGNVELTPEGMYPWPKAPLFLHDLSRGQTNSLED